MPRLSCDEGVGDALVAGFGDEPGPQTVRRVVGRVGLQDRVDVTFDDQVHTGGLEAPAFVAVAIDGHEQRSDPAVTSETHHRPHRARVVMGRPGHRDRLPGPALIGFGTADRDQQPSCGAGVGVAFEGEIADVQRDKFGTPEGGRPADEEQGAVALHQRVSVRAAGQHRDRDDDPTEIVETEGDRPALPGPDPASCPGDRGAYERSIIETAEWGRRVPIGAAVGANGESVCLRQTPTWRLGTTREVRSAREVRRRNSH